MDATSNAVETLAWTVDLGAALKQARLRKEWTQKRLASEMNVTQPTICNWERGTVGAPDVSEVKRIEELLGFKLTDGSSPADGDVRTDLQLWLHAQIEKRRGTKTIRVMAAEAGVSQPTIFNILNGTVIAPQRATIEKLKMYFGADELPEEVEREADVAARVGELGEFREFDPHDKDNWPTGPGVYILYDISGRPIYIGKSKNSVAGRLRDHQTRFWYKAPMVARAAYISVKDEKLVCDLETVLIKVLGPHAVINERGVVRDVDGAEVMESAVKMPKVTA
jgi:transcriptional regulator with XRE-family HTH domain